MTMSTPPSDTTCGSPACAAASSRSGPAENMPPATSPASSVVVRSSTPTNDLARTSASSERPPVPLAWKTSTS